MSNLSVLQKLYEEELKSVQTWMQGKFGDLIHGDNDDQNGQLAEAVCRSDLIRLCTFFGKRKSNSEQCPRDAFDRLWIGLM